jgi:hypothetical protein
MNHHDSTSDLFPREAILRFLDEYGTDGWRIIHPETLVAFGFPEALVLGFVESLPCRRGRLVLVVHVADTRPVPRVRGIDPLAFLRAIAEAVGADPDGRVGRAPQARAYSRAIRMALGVDIPERELDRYWELI